MKTLNYKMLDKVTTAGTTVVYSQGVKVEHLYTAAIQYAITGTTVNGSIVIQGSCDAGIGTDDDGTTVENWGDIAAIYSFTQAGTFFQNLDGMGYKWLRVKHTPNGGNGLLTVTINAKGA